MYLSQVRKEWEGFQWRNGVRQHCSSLNFGDGEDGATLAGFGSASQVERPQHAHIPFVCQGLCILRR